jgi:hypothetical protein
MLRSGRHRLGIESNERSKPFEGEGPVRDWQASLERMGLQTMRSKSNE